MQSKNYTSILLSLTVFIFVENC